MPRLLCSGCAQHRCLIFGLTISRIALYGLAHCLIDRSGRVIGVNLPLANEPLLPFYALRSSVPRSCIISMVLEAGVSEVKTKRTESGPERDPAAQLDCTTFAVRL